ncbi:MAG: V-type ATP synthase subunit E [Archaeoglobaceae archaeon]
MPLEPILQEIREKAESEAKRIREEAEREARRILEEARAEAEKILKTAREEAEKEVEALRKQELSIVSLEMKRELLNKQKEIVESVFEFVRQKLENMDAETKKRILKSLISRNAQPGMLVYSRKEDEEIVKEVIKELGIDLKYAGNIECLGGVVLEDPSGEVRINLTFDELLNQLYEQKMSEVTKMLFG